MKGRTSLKNNRNGNAALVAVLIMIILIGIGAIVMMLGGRNDIKETEDNPQVKKNEVVTTTTAVTAPCRKPRRKWICI